MQTQDIHFQVQGTLGGYRILFKTSNFPASFAQDLRRSDAQNNKATAGSESYALAFTSEGTIFSKCLNVWDFERRAIGNLMFSVCIPANKTIVGKVIKKLLDSFIIKYQNEGHIDAEYNLISKPNDWISYVGLANDQTELTNKGFNNIEHHQQGAGDAAFVYYTDDDDLLKKIDSGYQEEYKDYKQIFFINQRFENSLAKPLHALRHNPDANLTHKIAWDNPQYTLIIPRFENQVRVTVWVNNHIQRNTIIKIRKNDTIKITWERKFYHTKNSGEKSIHELESENYVSKNVKEYKIKIVDLNFIKYVFKFETKGAEDMDIKNPTFTLKKDGHNHKHKRILDNKLELTAEDFDNSKWTVIAEQGDYISDEYPINQPNTEDNQEISIRLPLHKRSLVETQTPSGINFKTNTPNHSASSGSNKKKYCIELDGGKWKNNMRNFPQSTDDVPNENIINNIIPPKYHRFKEFVETNETGRNECRFTLKAIYEKKPSWYQKIPLWTWIVLGIVIAFGSIVSLMYAPSKIEEMNTMAATIVAYTQGTELHKDTLASYQKQFCVQPVITQNNDTKKPWWRRLFSSQTNSAEQTPNHNFCSKVDSAIKLRQAIDAFDLTTLRSWPNYSPDQHVFKMAIDSIQQPFETQVSISIKLYLKGNMNLIDVSTQINSMQNSLIKAKSMAETNNESSVATDNVARQKPMETDNQRNQTFDIKEIPNNQKDTKAKEAIFWELIHTNNSQKKSYDDLFKMNWDQFYYDFYNKHISGSENFKKFKKSLTDMGEKARKKINTLTELETSIK